MTGPQAATVELQEILARAQELEGPISQPPEGAPKPPSNLGLAINAAQQLQFSTDNMRIYLAAGVRGWTKLAQLLRKAAQAYQQVDEGAAHALGSDTASILPATPGVTEDGQAVALSTTRVAGAAGPVEYADIKQRALDIEHGDQGASLNAFADAWESMQQNLQRAASRFRPFQYWEGAAADAVAATFDQHRTWLAQMAELCGTIAAQARTVTSTQRWAVQEHIVFNGTRMGYADLETLDRAYEQGGSVRAVAMARYAALQAKSDDVIAQYMKKAELPLTPVDPPRPPPAQPIDPAPSPVPNDGALLYSPSATAADGLPSIPSLPFGGAPMTPNGVMPPGALNGSMGTPGSSAGVRVAPAAYKGGGMPPMPSRSAMDSAEAVSLATARETGAGGGANLTAGGASGAGMAPVAPSVPGQGPVGKGARARQQDEPLYTEDRPWTEGLIGTLPLMGVAERKDSR